ncbi:TRAP transporter substrate-binding protein [Ureibacillus chungkukjangi]|uniref:Tripartite ATP-independent transporter DctP family solute receptor n=1 Tax=Ureibacillus chungkukjangi TaxID=1202712 RepID=A0A318TMP0_9BACL|nr:TRAP transporter substrate-binding protein [Ureibacillus chungkukjangi]MCM3389371.1 DctP family TRAP transporter solute-binding subunit [Ureibacillus chungkukjangi]PYF05137.1 tripartite ATP-independent transporter DctP family solute receptor [Ureibacillus chungkukjangi]
MKRRWKIGAIFLAICMLVLTACSGNENDTEAASSSGEVTKLRLGHIFPTDSVKDQASKLFAKRIEEETNGAIQISVFPASQLGGDEVMAQDISRGTLDMSFINQGSLSGLDSLLDFHYLPYIVTSYEQADKIFYGEGVIPKLMVDTLAKHNMTTLGFFENEFRGVSNSNRKIEKVEDLKGLKLRVPGSQAIKGFFEEAGSQALVMPFNELYLALQQGTVDGQDNGLLLTGDSKFQEVNKFYTQLNHVYASGSIVINTSKFNSLTPEQQEIFKAVGEEVQAWQIENNREATKNYIKMFEDAGVEVTELTEEQIKEFQEFGLSQWDNYESTYGADLIQSLKDELAEINK